MKATRIGWVVAAACVVIGLAGTSYGHVHVGIGFGTYIGPHWPHHHYYYAPDWYWYDAGWPYYYYPYGPVIYGPPVVERHVVVNEVKPAPAVVKPPTPTLSQADQQRQSELLKKLRIGGPDDRVQAMQDLCKYAGDSKVRQALEKTLQSDRDSSVRAAAAEALGRQSGKQAVPALKQAKENDSSREVQQAAYKALIMIEGY